MKLKEIFYFQKSDRLVILFFLCCIVIALAVLFGIGGQNTQTSLTGEDSLEARQSPILSGKDAPNSGYYDVEGKKVELFPFDPNTADSTQFQRLGLARWQIRNIYKYRAKGGIYRTPADFARLYGLTLKQYKALEPFIRISDDYLPASRFVHQTSQDERFERDTLRYPVKIGQTERIALNAADTSLLKKVPGIGSYFARRIVAYRERLGGYYSTEQLKEIDDFPEESLKYFVLGTANLRKMNVNRLSLSQLKRHPYINFYQAKAITDYRRMRGNLTSLQELRLLKDFPPAAIERLEPYVEY